MPRGGNVRGERGEILRLEGRVAVPPQPQVAVPDVTHEAAGADDLRVEPVPRPELGECRVGDGQLLVRRRNECEPGIAGVDDEAGAEIDRQRCRIRRIDVRYGKCTVESAVEGRVGAPRRRDGDQQEQHDREA